MYIYFHYEDQQNMYLVAKCVGFHYITKIIILKLTVLLLSSYIMSIWTEEWQKHVYTTAHTSIKNLNKKSWR